MADALIAVFTVGLFKCQTIWHLASLPFTFYYIKYVLTEKFSEILTRDTYVNLVVYLNGNAYTVTLADTEAAGKHDLFGESVFRNGAFKKLYYVLRSFKVA